MSETNNKIIVKKNILFIGMTTNRGGTETFIFNIAKFLVQNYSDRFNIFILDDKSGDISLKSEIENIKVKIIKLNLPVGMKNHFKKIKVLKNFFKSNQFDIVHINSNSPSDAFYLSALKSFDLKIIYHSHNTSIAMDQILRKIVFLLRYPFLVKEIKNSTAIKIAASKQAGKWMFGNDSNFQVLPNGVNTNEYVPDVEIRNSLRKEMGISSNSFVFSFIGRFDYQKYPEFVVKVFDKFLEDHPEYCGKVFVVFAGNGSLVERTKNMVSNKMIPFIKFLGVRHDIPDIMRMADFLILPSRFEAMPFVVIEAQASGLKILQSVESRNRSGEVTNGHYFLSISEPVSNWSACMYQMIQNRSSLSDRFYDNELMAKSNYNIFSSLKKFVESVYLNC
ncbi:glycosyl transferase [Oenococcus oeni]|uniref:glycosyltransferase n=1 Tax=Oenococcus oeni TaxID=1247 RepID=UPI0004A0B11F|nr:glycosyltransferase [Oenococcus oeni]KDP19781.1 glycosyl transferase [Oenococcus oeni]